MHTLEKLKVDPFNLGMTDLAERLSRGTVVEVHLEPGDATRYDMILAPLMDDDGDELVTHLAVTRTHGGRGGGVRSCALLVPFSSSDPVYWQEEMYRLADGNDWTGQVFDWWFRKLWDAIDA